MRGNKRTDTKPEIAIRSALHRRGYRFRKDYKIAVGSIAVRPDVVFTRQRIAVFIDGCFWHRCPEHGKRPRANPEYWQRKLDRNVERDRRVACELSTAGWSCLRIWEHTPIDEAVELVALELAARDARFSYSSAIRLIQKRGNATR